ncbi:protein of unknown function [Pseudomonas sp. JV551A1]|uniref:HTH luxR-type domain-containing protein n=1 Tax=Pseudomonas inefficax TaxID=2078786 RepID=A0AAQ1PA97_9PSED|nr:protein of unknown function [Pseudomonas sp. JV551A1]SPO62057.1 protein of unknown function [Pseudomonas inefficax]
MNESWIGLVAFRVRRYWLQISILAGVVRQTVFNADAQVSEGLRGFERVGEQLTVREQEVVGLMISGLGTKELARYLGISMQTVKVHRRNIYSKLGISTELQLCSLFLRPGNAFDTRMSVARIG